MLGLQHARSEMVEHIEKSRLSSARRMKVLKAVENDINVGMEVLLYREKPVNTWTGPFKVTALDGNTAWRNKNGRKSLASIDKMKEFKLPQQRPHESTTDLHRNPLATQTLPENNLSGVFDDIIAADALICSLGKVMSDLTTSLDENGGEKFHTPNEI